MFPLQIKIFYKNILLVNLDFNCLRLFLIITLWISFVTEVCSQPPEYTGYITPISAPFDFKYTDFYDIDEDWNGFIWIATVEGLYRFDGTKVKYYSHSSQDTILPHYSVFDILVDDERQVLWLATAFGLTRLDPATESSVNYTWSYEDPRSLADNIVRYVYKDRSGKIWVNCRAQGLSLYQEQTDDFIHFHFDKPDIEILQKQNSAINEGVLNSYNYIVQDIMNDDLLWLGSPLGLVSFNSTTKAFKWHFENHPAIATPFSSNSIRTIFPLDSSLLIGTVNGLLDYNIVSNNIQFPKESKHSVLNEVKTILPRSLNELWITYGNGLAAYNISTKQITGTWPDNKSINQFNGIRFIDRKNHVWIHSSGETVMYDPLKQIVRNYLLPDTLQAEPKVIKLIDPHTLFMLTSNPGYYHLFNLKTSNWKNIVIKSNVAKWQNIVWRDMVVLDDKHWLLISQSKVFQLNIETGKLELFPINANIKDALLVRGLLDSRGYLWLASIRQGLFRVHLESKEVVHYVDELTNEFSKSLYTWILDLLEDQSGNVWIRLARSYAVYEPDTDQIHIYPYYKNADRTFRYINNFTETTDGDIWVSSTDGGIGQIKSGQYKKGLRQKISEKEGLLSNRILKIAFDQNQKLWILSKRGISSYELPSGIIKNFTWDRGIPQTRQIIPVLNNKIALSLKQGGIGILDPTLIQSEKITPQPYITEVKTKNSIAYKGGNKTTLEYLNIESGRDYLSFEFSAMGYSNPKAFSYRLEPVDDEWIETMEHRSTSYSNLSPGDYIFRLRSRLEGGEWSKEQKVAIYLAPFFWETFWFKALVFLILGMFGYGFYRWRLEDVKQKERLKAEFQHKIDEAEMQALRTQMNPHFLFNSLNAIQLYIIENRPSLAVSYLDRFSKLMRLILRNSRAKTVPLKDELDALKLYIELENLRFKIPFDYSINVSPDINTNNVEIPPMILQPFVENAIWHGIQHKKEKGLLSLDIILKNDFLICSIQDNGIGRQTAYSLKKSAIKKQKSMGMKITQDRLDMINHARNQKATMEIIDLYDEKNQPMGTKVVVRLPVN